MIGAIWRYRGFVWGSVKREFQLRYRGSILGATWAVLNPLALILVYTVVFSRIMRARLPEIDDSMAYGVFLCAGILTWGFFIEVLTRSQTMFLEQGTLLKKASFPRSAIPTVVTAIATLNFAIVFGLFLLFLLVTSRFPGLAILAFIPLLALQQGLAAGLGLILGTINVFFRDVGQAVGVIIQFWFWLTPIVYPSSILPVPLKQLIETWNPVSALVSAYQGIVLSGAWPEWSLFLPHCLLTVILLTLGYFVFTRLSGEMVDEL